MTNTVEERVDLLERHARFSRAIDERVNQMFDEFRSRLRQIHTYSGATNTGQLEYAMQNSRSFSELDGKVAGLGKQCRQMDEKLVDIEVKLDQMLRLLTPEPIQEQGLTSAY